MKNVLKNLILIVLIIAVAGGVGFLIFRAVKSVNYNKSAKNPVVTMDIENYGKVQIELEPEYAPNTVATIIKLVENGYYDGKVFYGTDSRAVTGGMILKEEQEDSSTDESEETATTETDATSTPEGEETATTKLVAQEDKLRVSDLDKSVTPYIDEDDPEYSTTDEDKRGDETKDYKVSIEGEFVANGFNDNTLRFEKGTVGLYRSNYEVCCIWKSYKRNGYN